MYSIVLMMALSGSADVPMAHGCNGGSCSGCSGATACCGGGGHGCHGSKGCCGGGGFLGGLFKGHGCKGCHGCNGSSCCGGYSCTGAGCTGAGCTGAKPEEKKEMPKEKKEGVSAPATIVVNVPANAKIFIDENPTRSNETVRTFVTPALEQGKDFYYNIKAELVVDGQTQTATQRVTVRAGQESRVNVEFPVSSVASK